MQRAASAPLPNKDNTTQMPLNESTDDPHYVDTQSYNNNTHLKQQQHIPSSPTRNCSNHKVNVNASNFKRILPDITTINISLASDDTQKAAPRDPTDHKLCDTTSLHSKTTNTTYNPQQMVSSQQQKSFMDKLSDFDKRFSNKIATMELGILIELIIIIPSLMFSPIGVPLFIAANVIFFKSFVFLVAMLLGLLLSEGIKKICARHRPILQSHKPLNITQHLMKVDSFSMPSGDTLQAAVFAVVVTYHLNQSMLAYLVIPWAAFGRVYWGNHWMADCIVGAFIGVFVSLIICAKFETLLVHNFW